MVNHTAPTQNTKKKNDEMKNAKLVLETFLFDTVRGGGERKKKRMFIFKSIHDA